MATTTFQPPVNSKYYLNPQTELSPPATYLYGKGVNAPSSTMPPPTPPSNNDAPANPTFDHNRPTSSDFPRYPVHIRQLRPPRQPLYIPAALRPTELPARPKDIPNRPRAPDTPPASKDNSFDSAKGTSASTENIYPRLSTGREGQSLDDLVRSLGRAATNESLEEQLPEVTGPPSTGHWKPDALAIACAVCHQTFTWFFRRHHCRKCGQVVCHQDSKNTVPLDQRAQFHPDSTLR